MRESAEPQLRGAGVRSLSVTIEEVWTEGSVALERPVLRATAAAVLPNPWAGTPVDTDLDPEARRIAPLLAVALTNALTDALGGVDAIEAFGKGAVVGTAGEVEHGAALIHTPFFGNLVREFLGGTSILCFADTRGPSGTPLQVPMWHKTEAATRSHYQTMDVRVAGAPAPDELLIIAAASTGPRPFARIGDRRTDPAVTSAVLEGTTV